MPRFNKKKGNFSIKERKPSEKICEKNSFYIISIFESLSHYSCAEKDKSIYNIHKHYKKESEQLGAIGNGYF